MDLSWPCRVFSGLWLQDFVSESRGSGRRPWGPLPVFFRTLRACEPAVRLLSCGCRIPFWRRCSPRRGACPSCRSPCARPAVPLLRGQGGGGRGWMADPLLRAPSRPRSLYLPPVSPVIPVLVGTHHSPISQVRSPHTEEKLCCPSCGQLHPRPSRVSLRAPPGRPLPSLQPLVQMLP